MPWCPVCKNEYRKGITVCADCKVNLVEELKEDLKEQYELLVDLKQEENAKKLVSYLEYSKINAFYEPKEGASSYSIYVAKKEYNKAKKAFGAFYTVERTAEYETMIKQMIASGNETIALDKDAAEEDVIGDASVSSDSVEGMEESFPDDLSAEDAMEESEADIDNSVSSAGGSDYMTKAEKSADYRSSAITFTAFGSIGLVVMILHWAGVFHYFSTISAVIITVMFAAFLIIGIDSFKRAAKAKTEAAEEERLVKELTGWLEKNLTFDMLAAADQEALSREANFLNEIAEMKRIILKQFGTLDTAFLDQFTEEYYNNHFE